MRLFDIFKEAYKEQSEKNKEKFGLNKIKDDNWEKVAPSFYVREEYQKLKIGIKEIDFSSIIDVELLEDETTISKTTGTNKTKDKSKKHIAPVKGLVGGMVFGPLGAAVGASSGKTTTKGKTKVNTKTKEIDYCKKLQLKITTNDIKNPMILHDFIHSKTRKESFSYKTIYNNAQKCNSIVQIIIKNNEE